MSFEEVKRSTASAALLVRVAASRGIEAACCLVGTGIRPEQIEDPQATIESGQELRLIRNILVLSGSAPGLGLDAGTRCHLSSHGIWGYVLSTSRSFRQAAELAVRYLDLSYAFVRFRLESQGEDLLLVLDDEALPKDLRQFLVERDFAAWATAALELKPGGFPARAAQFRFDKPSYASRFDRLCGVRPSFGAKRNTLLLEARVLDSPLPSANPALARLCEEQCRQLLSSRRVRAGTAGEVRNRLLREPARMPSMEQVARELHMATRSLRRHLEEEGTSFRGLVDEVRQALAEELLVGGAMKLEEIASRLGYSESAPFIAAFKRWHQMSPSRYRKLRSVEAYAMV